LAKALQRADRLAQGHLVAYGFPFAYPEMSGYLGGSGGVMGISTARAKVWSASWFLRRQVSRAAWMIDVMSGDEISKNAQMRQIDADGKHKRCDTPPLLQS